MAAIRREGREVERGHAYDPEKGHGFIDSQKHGMEVFRKIPPSAPLMVVEAVWQYSQHILRGLLTHRGPILTVANWSGEWPGLVGMLNLNASLTKAGVKYSTLWSGDFTDDFFIQGLQQLAGGRNRWSTTPATCGRSNEFKLPARAARAGGQVARRTQAATRPSWASSTKAAWACTTPSFPTNCCIRPACSRSA